MIIYGSKAKQLATESIADKCPNCGNQNVQLHAFQKYAHIFWIPFFPIGKTVVSECSHCKQILKAKDLPSSFTLSAQNLKLQSKTPIWTFSGLALFAILISLGVINDKKKDERNAQLILAPRQGDIFEIKTKDNQYTLYKVNSVEEDSVVIRVNNYETNKLTGLADLKRKGAAAYSEEVFALAKNDLKKMLEKGEVIDIERQ